MADNLTPEDRRKAMKAVKGRKTSLERRLFSILMRMGLSGWRQNADEVIGKPDVIFADKHVAVFIDGCFWHGCPVCKRPLPVSNRTYWEGKIRRNVAIARVTNRKLRSDGWFVIRIWEHQFRDPAHLKNIKCRIWSAVKDPRHHAKSLKY